MSPQQLFALLSSLIFAYFTIVFIEIFARKEYRWDRLLAHIHDFGIREMLFPSLWRLPKLTHPRNILILLLVICFLNVFSFITNNNLLYFSLFLVSAPVTAFFCVFVSVRITAIPVAWYHDLIISRARERLLRYKPFVIGVTGSYGKSMTKSYIAHILSKSYKIIQTPQNTNTDIGIAKTILKEIKSEGLYFVVEMGAYKKGEISKICDFVKPQWGVITSFGTQHAGLFGGSKAIILAKLELAQSLPTSGYLFVPEKVYSKIPKNLLPSIPSKTIKYLSIDSDPHAQAIQAAVKIASTLEMPYAKIQESIERLETPNNLKVTRNIAENYDMLISTYSSNTDAFISHLELARKTKTKNLVLVTPGIIELGDERKRDYEKIINKIPKKTHIFTSDEYFGNLCKEKHFPLVTIIRSPKLLFKTLKKSLTEGCLILVEGRFRQDFVDTIKR